MQDMASEGNPGARSRSLKRNASGAKPPALEDLPSSGDEGGPFESVAAGYELNKAWSKPKAHQTPTVPSDAAPSKDRAQKARVRSTAAQVAAEKRHDEIESLFARGEQHPEAAFLPPRIDKNDNKALVEAASMMRDLLELMRKEKKLFGKRQTSKYFTGAEDYSRALETLLAVDEIEAKEIKKQQKSIKRKRNDSEFDVGVANLESNGHAVEPAKYIRAPQDALRILEQTEDAEKLKYIRDHLAGMALSLEGAIDQRVQQRADLSNAAEYVSIDDEKYALDFIQATLDSLRAVVKRKIKPLGKKKRAAKKAAPEAVDSQEP